MLRPSSQLAIVPIEAVAPGDAQVLAAREQGKIGTPVVDLDILAGFPAVESVIASTEIRASRGLPNIRELLLSLEAPLPDAATLRLMTGLEALYAKPSSGRLRLDLEALPAGQMRKLALTRWLTRSLAPLERMTGLEQLKVDLFREPLDSIAGMPHLKYLHILGPAQGLGQASRMHAARRGDPDRGADRESAAVEYVEELAQFYSGWTGCKIARGSR